MEKTLTEAEKQQESEKLFIEYWEKNRLREKKTLNQLLIGLPLGILFAAPVLLSLFGGWYSRANMQANARLNPGVLLIAMLLIIVFIAVFSRRHKWEMKEQQYREFLARRDNAAREHVENNPENGSSPAAKQDD